MKKAILFLFCLVLAGCGGKGVYSKVRGADPGIAPRVYRVNYDDAFVVALHAVEMQKKWKLDYFDKNTGIIEASTPKKDKLTVRVNSLDRTAVKIFAYCDTPGFSWGGEGRLKKNLSLYFASLDSHLKGFDEEALQ